MTRRKNRRIIPHPERAEYFYPNRKLGFEYAKTYDGLDPIAVGNITMANMMRNECFILEGKLWRTGNISNKQLSFVGADIKSIRPETPKFETMARNIGNAVMNSKMITSHKMLADIFMRDPAANENPCFELIDNEAFRK